MHNSSIIINKNEWKKEKEEEGEIKTLKKSKQNFIFLNKASVKAMEKVIEWTYLSLVVVLPRDHPP